MAEVHGEIRKEIEEIELPEGYTFFWDAQYKDQGEAMQAIAKFFPLAFLMLIVILVALFGNFRQPVIILCILPLSLIGVAIGMLLTGFDFGFFPIAGWLGLLGMIIKNVIVLLDEINIQRRKWNRTLYRHHRSYSVKNKTCTYGSDHYYFRNGSVIVRYSIRRYGSHYYFRTDVLPHC